MADGKNEAFLQNPLNFIQTTAVDITRFDASITGRTVHMDVIDEDIWFSMFKALCATLREVAFDLVPRSHSTGFFGITRNFCVLRFDRTTFTQDFITKMGELKNAKANETFQVRNQALLNRGNNENSVAWHRWLTAQKALDTFKDRYTSRLDKFVTSNAPIQGYFFPYLSPPGGPAQVNQRLWDVRNMGWVDVPRQNPAHPFVFTGQMNGCAMVITDSPLGNAYFRAYHYPNVSSYPRFKDQARWQGERRRRVWTVEEYGDANNPDAFNFLHYHNNEWYLYCQPQTQNIVDGRPVMSIRQKTVRGVQLPGRIRLSELTNTFPNNYL